MVDIDRIHKQSPGYWKLNESFPVSRAFRDQVSRLVYRELTTAIVNKHWFIRVDAVRLGKEIVLDESKTEGYLVRKLEDVLRKGIATDMLAARLVFDQFFYAKHEGCIVRARVHVLRLKGTKAVRWARVTETLRRNEATIQSLVSCDGCMITDN